MPVACVPLQRFLLSLLRVQWCSVSFFSHLLLPLFLRCESKKIVTKPGEDGGTHLLGFFRQPFAGEGEHTVQWLAPLGQTPISSQSDMLNHRKWAPDSPRLCSRIPLLPTSGWPKNEKGGGRDSLSAEVTRERQARG